MTPVLQGAWRRGEVDAVATPDGALLVHTPSGVELRIAGGRLRRGACYAAAPRDVRFELARLGAILRLRARGRQHLHAAGVADPRGRAWILAGESGSGKSTLAYALARVGWASLGDDGVVVEPRAEGIVAHAWREPLRVSRDLASAFPELRTAGRVVDAADARRRVEVDVARVQRAPVHAIIFVERGARDALEPMGQTEALARLVRQSPWVLFGDGASPGHLAVLRTLAGTVPALRLRHTRRQLRDIPHTLGESLA